MKKFKNENIIMEDNCYVFSWTKDEGQKTIFHVYDCFNTKNYWSTTDIKLAYEKYLELLKNEENDPQLICDL